MSSGRKRSPHGTVLSVLYAEDADESDLEIATDEDEADLHAEDEAEAP